MTVAAPIFRQVCQFTGAIAEAPESSDAVANTAAPERPRARHPRGGRAGRTTTPNK